MFPIPWNKAYRKKDGTVVNIDDAIKESGSSDIPEYSAADAGKVLGVNEEGNLVWIEVTGGVNQFEFAKTVKNTSTVESSADKGGE